MAVVLTRTALDALIDHGSGHGTDTPHYLGDGSIGLFAEPFNPGVNARLQDLPEANYPGYARQAITGIHGPIHDAAGRSAINLGAYAWAPSGDDSANTIYGWFSTGTDSTTLLAYEAFAQPVPLPFAFSLLQTVIEIGLTPGSDFGAGVVLS